MDVAFVKYLHFMGVILLSSALIGEHLLISKMMDSKSFKKLIIINGVYGIGALMALVGGLILWFGLGKPSAFYSQNFLFHIKLTLFGSLVALSVFPSLFFFRNLKTNNQIVQLPNFIFVILRMELFLLAFLPLLAAFIAQGVGADKG